MCLPTPFCHTHTEGFLLPPLNRGHVIDWPGWVEGGGEGRPREDRQGKGSPLGRNPPFGVS